MSLDKFGCSFESKHYRNDYIKQMFRGQQIPKTSDGNYDIQNMKLCNVGEPTLAQDSSTKSYVDSVGEQMLNKFEVHVKQFVDHSNRVYSIISDLQQKTDFTGLRIASLKSDLDKKVMRANEKLAETEERLQNEMKNYDKECRNRIDMLKIPKINDILKTVVGSEEKTPTVEQQVHSLINNKTNDLSTQLEAKINESTQNLEKELNELRERDIAKICSKQSTQLEAKINEAIENLDKQLRELREKEIAKICSKKTKSLKTKLTAEVDQSLKEINEKINKLDEIIQNISASLVTTTK